MVSVRERKKHGYESPRPDVERHVPRGARNILELGCSAGALGASIKRRQDAAVLGVEIDPSYARDAGARLDRVVCSSAEAFLAGPVPPEAPFDCLIAADVLEHLVNPWTVLSEAVALLEHEATVIVSLPNVLYWKALREVILRRRWPRKLEGTFDQTHLRWFAQADAVDLVRSAGLSVREVDPRFWTIGWRLRLAQRLYATPLCSFLAAQHVIVARKP